MKRVLCIVGSMNIGGAETFLMKMYHRLDRTKYQMDFCVTMPGLYDKEIHRLGGKIYFTTPKTQNPLKAFYSIKNIVKNNKYEYVMRISQNSLSAMELLAAHCGGAHTLIFRSSNSDAHGKGARIVHTLFMPLAKVVPTVRIAPSTEAAEFMFGKGAVRNGKAHILHNALDLRAYCFNEDAGLSIRQEFNIEAGAIVVGHIGRFTEQKNHGFLIDVFKQFHQKVPDSVLMLVGTGELEEKIRVKTQLMGLSDCVYFTGVRSDVPALLSAMNVFVFPSLYEGMPNTLIEAQATGLPCVAADTITREANITGLVDYLPLGNVQRWTEKVQTALQKERQDTSMALQNAGYEIETVCRQFEQMTFGD